LVAAIAQLTRLVALTENIDLSLSSSKGTAILETLNRAVEIIRDTVAKIEPKLPQTALGY
jgi:hypothetical protein